MMGMSILGAALALVAAGRAEGAPKQSADVVRVELSPGSLADGLEMYYVSLRIAKGWRLFANAGARRHHFGGNVSMNKFPRQMTPVAARRACGIGRPGLEPASRSAGL